MKAVLTYHSIDDSGSVISVTRKQLADHLDALVSSGTRVVPLDSILEAKDQNVVAITFDDGFSSFQTEALPELQRRQLAATVFVVPRYVALRNEWETYDSRASVPLLPLMSWNDLRALDRETVALGAHGVSHRSLRGRTHAEVLQELSSCADTIADETGQRPRTFAFPYGDFDDNAVSAASEIFDISCTTQFSTVSDKSNRSALPRLDAFYFRDNDMLRRFGSIEFATWIRVRQFARNARRRMSMPGANG